MTQTTSTIFVHYETWVNDQHGGSNSRHSFYFDEGHSAFGTIVLSPSVQLRDTSYFYRFCYIFMKLHRTA